MISESICDAIVNLLHEKTITVQGKTFTSRSRREKEMVVEEDKNDRTWQPSIIVSFSHTMPGIRTQGDIISQDDDTKMVTFGQQEITDVEIIVSAKEVQRGDQRISAKDMASSILGLVNRQARKKFNAALAPLNASIYQKKGFEYENLTKFVQSDGRAMITLRFQIEHEITWDLSDEDAPVNFGPPTYAIIFTMDTEPETIVQEEE